MAVAMEWGATLQEWDHFAKHLGLLSELLPVVSNPLVIISKNSSLTGPGKVPSRYNFEGEMTGFHRWQQGYTTQRDLDGWLDGPAKDRDLAQDYGICIRTRKVHAIDVDIDDPHVAAKVLKIIESVLPHLRLPRRVRPGSSRFLIPFKIADEAEPLTKRVVRLGDPGENKGVIEILGDGQQFVAAGTHINSKGEDTGRYEWVGTLPAEIPVLDELAWEMLWTALSSLAPSPKHLSISRQAGPRDPASLSGWVGGKDELADWLVESWTVFDTGRQGELMIECPFADEHTGDSGPTSTVYFLRGTGGYEQGHFKCLHAHCEGRSDHEFKERIGYEAAQFEDLTLTDEMAGSTRSIESQEPSEVHFVNETVQLVEIDSKHRYPSNMRNMVRALSVARFCGMNIIYDDFRDQIMVAPYGKDGQWVSFRDEYYGELQQNLEQRAIKDITLQKMRQAVHVVAKRHVMDTARVWLDSLEWDGRPRVEAFLTQRLGVEDDEYTRAVSRYIWTALAGRIIEPGCQADMTPVFYGAQGQRKTSAIKAMAPHRDFFAELSFGDSEANLSRRMRGKLVIEMAELKGLRSQHAETIKAFMTRTHEEWVPKFIEHTTSFARRCLFIASTNSDEFLDDHTGERRWLPIPTGVVGKIDVDGIRRHREHLWAEGAVLFMLGGVDWEQAEHLGKEVHVDYKTSDPWDEPVARWLAEPDADGVAPQNYPDGVSTTDVALGALGLAVAKMTRSDQMRIGNVLRNAGMARRRRLDCAQKRVWRFIGRHLADAII